TAVTMALRAGLNGGDYFRIICRDHVSEGESQQGGVKPAPAAKLLRKGLQVRIPCFFKDRLRNSVCLLPPCCDVVGKAEQFCDPGSTIQSHLAQPTAIRQRTTTRT